MSKSPSMSMLFTLRLTVDSDILNLSFRSLAVNHSGPVGSMLPAKYASSLDQGSVFFDFRWGIKITFDVPGLIDLIGAIGEYPSKAPAMRPTELPSLPVGVVRVE